MREGNRKQTKALQKLSENPDFYQGELLQYLNQPRKEEYESDEVEVGTPAGKAVDGSVHEEHPAFLGGGLVDCEDAGACHREESRLNYGGLLMLKIIFQKNNQY